MMTYIPRSSFMPQDTPGAIPKMVQKKRTIRIFSVLSGTMIVGAVILSGVVYFYQGYLAKQLQELKAEVGETTFSASAASNVAEVASFADRVDLAQKLLDNHLAPSRIFQYLEQNTKQTVQITDFKYTYDPGFEAFLELAGGTSELMSVALQKDQLKKERILDIFVLDSITYGNDAAATTEENASSQNQVEFSVKGPVDRKMVQYTGENLPDQVTPPATPAQAQSTSTAMIDTELSGDSNQAL